jgi:hypothetical protein
MRRGEGSGRRRGAPAAPGRATREGARSRCALVCAGGGRGGGRSRRRGRRARGRGAGGGGRRGHAAGCRGLGAVWARASGGWVGDDANGTVRSIPGSRGAGAPATGAAPRRAARARAPARGQARRARPRRGGGGSGRPWGWAIGSAGGLAGETTQVGRGAHTRVSVNTGRGLFLGTPLLSGARRARCSQRGRAALTAAGRRTAARLRRGPPRWRSR